MQFWVWAGHGPILEKFWAVACLVHVTMISDVKHAVWGLGCMHGVSLPVGIIDIRLRPHTASSKAFIQLDTKPFVCA